MFLVYNLQFVFQSLSYPWLFTMPWTGAHQASLSFIISQSLLKLMSIKSVIPFNHVTLCHPLLLPSIFPIIKVFSNESVLPVRWPKYWNFSISSFIEYSGLISFRMDCFELLAVQRTLKSLFQHQFFGAQPSLGNITAGVMLRAIFIGAILEFCQLQGSHICL